MLLYSTLVLEELFSLHVLLPVVVWELHRFGWLQFDHGVLSFLAGTFDRAHEYITGHSIISKRLWRIGNLILAILHVLGVGTCLWTILRIVAVTARLTVPRTQDAFRELTHFALGKRAHLRLQLCLLCWTLLFGWNVYTLYVIIGVEVWVDLHVLSTMISHGGLILQYGLRIHLYPRWYLLLLVFVLQKVVYGFGRMRHDVSLRNRWRIVKHWVRRIVVIPKVFDLLSDAWIMWLHLRWVFESLVFIMDIVILSVSPHVNGARKYALLMLLLLQLYSWHAAQLFLALRITRLYHTALTSLVEIVTHVCVGFLALVCLLVIFLGTTVVLQLILVQLIINLRNLWQRLLFLLMRVKFMVRTLHLSYLASEVVPRVDACVRLQAPAALWPFTAIRIDISTLQAAWPLVIISVNRHEFSGVDLWCFCGYLLWFYIFVLLQRWIVVLASLAALVVALAPNCFIGHSRESWALRYARAPIFQTCVMRLDYRWAYSVLT